MIAAEVNSVPRIIIRILIRFKEDSLINGFWNIWESNSDPYEDPKRRSTTYGHQCTSIHGLMVSI